ncbi:MAG: ATP-dependent 6-phosphofructokinase [Bacteroidales bacterium]|nr:ATP-dependent 6-phosphofructokinase [Bacteroidales bacterium]
MKNTYSPNEFIIKELGTRRVNSPIRLSEVDGDGIYNYLESDERILYDPNLKNLKTLQEQGIEPISFEKTGPYEKIFFDPSKTKVGIVTCGGLCPGLNNVIRGLVMELFYRYNVNRVIGFKYGYEGFVSEFGHSYVELTPQNIENIHTMGGTFLGSSRGKQDVETVVDTLDILNINVLFTIGGDGTLRGAHGIVEEIEKRGLKISVIGIPKTIDNDINFIDRSFGFETAVSIASEVIKNAHNEAKGAHNGIAIVKLMGRQSGFIAATAALATQEANFVLVPETVFSLEGEKSFIEVLKKRTVDKSHSLVIVGEGAGQYLFEDQEFDTDASGNLKFKDIGIYLKNKIAEGFKKDSIAHTIKYIDPSYIIRSAPANASDSRFCIQLAQQAVHAAMAGKTDAVVGYWNQNFTLLPIPVTVKERKQIDLEGELWWSVLETTGQPTSMK